MNGRKAWGWDNTASLDNFKDNQFTVVLKQMKLILSQMINGIAEWRSAKHQEFRANNNLHLSVIYKRNK